MRPEIQGLFKKGITPETEWMEVIAVLMDNAIEASNSGEAIYLKSRQKENKIEFTVSNPAAPLSNPEFFTFVFPLLVVLPLCWNIFYERKNNFMLYVLPRVSEKKYLLAKWLVYGASAFSILFLPYMASALAALYANPPFDGAEAVPFEHVFMDSFTKTPLLYAFLLSCWRGFIGILTMSLGFVIALYAKNIFVVLTGAFVYAVLENFILAVLQLEQYRLVTAFEPSIISADAVGLSSFLVGPFLLLMVTALTFIYFKWIKKTAVASDHYYLTYFVIPMLLFFYLFFIEDDSEIVLVRYKSYFSYFCQKWFAGGRNNCPYVCILGILDQGIGIAGSPVYRNQSFYDSSS